MTDLQLEAPAKINLGLEVLRRRADGFHDINTVFAAVDLCDLIGLRLRDDGAVECRVEGNENLAAGDHNLCVRAARALRDAAGDPGLGLEIDLTKRIPMGAGLGGGSSDAAAVLLGACRLWGIDPPEGLLPRLAIGLGSDVPFFLSGGIAPAGGQGEILTPTDLELPYRVLLVNPGIHVPTPWAYRAIGRTGERPASDLGDILARGLDDPEILRRELVNDFEEPVFAEHPLLRELKGRLHETGALYAAMSGSGSTMFGLYAETPGEPEAFSPFWHIVTGFRKAQAGSA